MDPITPETEDIDNVDKGEPMEANLLKTMKRLTPRAYLGDGYIFEFRNNTTGEYLIESCTQAEYEAITVSALNNPVKAGWTFLGGAGGTIKVDTPNSTLGEDDYTDIGTEYAVGTRNLKVQKDEIILDEIDKYTHFRANNLIP